MKFLHLLFLIGIAMPMTLSAQENDSTAKAQSPVQPAVNNTVVETLSETIQNLKDENKNLQNELKQLKESKEQAAQSGMAQSKLLTDSLAQAKKLLDEKSKKLDEQKALSDSLEKMLKTIDAVVYKECLIYPISIRYNQRRIDECLQALNAYTNLVDKEQQSEELKQCIKLYKHFLIGSESSPASYQTYTKEIIDKLSEISSKFKKAESRAAQTKNAIVLEALKKENNFQQYIESLSYSKYYKKRNVPPYESIRFLDQVLDHLKLIIKESRDISGDIEKLKESLMPQ